jgi:hypothetical protein
LGLDVIKGKGSDWDAIRAVKDEMQDSSRGKSSLSNVGSDERSPVYQQEDKSLHQGAELARSKSPPPSQLNHRPYAGSSFKVRTCIRNCG